MRLRLIEWVRMATARLRLRACTHVGKGVTVRGRVLVHGGGDIVIGDNVLLDARFAPIELHARPGARIELGCGVRIESGTSLEALASIRVGQNAVLGGFAKVLDSQFHPLFGSRHDTPPDPKPVVIEANCELGWRATVLPGGNMGRGSYAMPGATVTRNVPAGMVIGGAPPRLSQARKGDNE